MKICVASLAFHDFFMDNLHQMISVMCTVYLTDSIPFSEYLRSEFPWDARTDTVEITGIPPHKTLLAEI